MFLVFILLLGGAQAISKAPDFEIRDVNSGKAYRLSDFHGKVVLIDFMSIDCEGCKKVENSLREIWGDYNSSAIFITVDIGPTDTEEELKEREIPWISGLNSSLSLITGYRVSSTPKIVIIDQDGYIVMEKSEVMGAPQLREALDRAISGNAERVDIQEMSIYMLAVFAGIASFFSPCSFPMLPGYIAYYFGIEKKGSSLKKAVVGGGSAALGIIAVYMVVGAFLIYSASLIAPFIPMLGVVVGSLLIIFGVLMFTPLQYDALLRPFRPLSEALKKKEGDRGFKAKLFGYGLAYGGAATGCTAPVFLAVIVGAMTTSLFTGIVALSLYSAIAGALMVLITVTMAAFESRAIDILKKHTETIKIVSALVLIAVGIYLIAYHL